MKIKDIFEKDYNRNSVIRVSLSNSEKDYVCKLINEFSFTQNVLDNLLEFFICYNHQLENQEFLHTLILGERGTGKSYFLKILSLLFDNYLKIDNETLLNYIKKQGKLNERIMEEIEKYHSIGKDVISFNVNSKKIYSDNKSILHILFNEFNKLRGFNDLYPHLYYFEKQLFLNDLFEDFKNEFKKINGNEWEDKRSDFYFISDRVIESAVNIGFLNQNEAERWFDKLYENYEFSVDEFCAEINEYCENKCEKYHIIFCIDELISYIGASEKLLIEFQEIMNQLSRICSGRVIIITTTHLKIENWNKILSECNVSNLNNIFVKNLIFDRENLIDAVKLNLLSKKSKVTHHLTTDFNDNFNLFNSEYFKDFDIQINDFLLCYPFLNYQFDLFMEIFENFIHSYDGKSFITWGEEHFSLFIRCEEVLTMVANENYGLLIPFNLFFNELFLNHNHIKLFHDLNENNKINSFDSEVLKVIFMLGYSDKIDASSKNITALMISHVKDNPCHLNNCVNHSLKNLLNESLIKMVNNSYKVKF